MARVHQMRAGAPDKICLWTDGSYDLVKHDNTNLVDYTKDEVIALCKDNEFILPADEGDIRHANNIFDMQSGVDQSWILLPQTNIGEGYCKVIDYDTFIPKDSKVYKNLGKFTSIYYSDIKYTFTPEEFRTKLICDSKQELSELLMYRAVKTTTGSGSRGVLLYDIDRAIKWGGKYREFVDLEELHHLCDFAEKEGCNIIIQDLIPNSPDLTKVNVDFIIRDGKFLGYKWDKTDPSAVFTNWNFGWTIVNEYTNKIMTELANYLINEMGIHNAIMNFEAFSDLKSVTWLVEFNWRYSNSMFEGQAAEIDLISHYLNSKPFEFPYGEHKFSRFWQCKYYEDIENYSSGK